jgi:hypothetical protein
VSLCVTIGGKGKRTQPMNEKKAKAKRKKHGENETLEGQGVLPVHKGKELFSCHNKETIRRLQSKFKQNPSELLLTFEYSNWI